MKRKCSHMWKWSVLCPFNLSPLEFQPDQTGNSTKKSQVCKIILLFYPTVVAKGNWVI